MHNGLKPSRRAFKGIGWNRALPSAFGFGNGWYPDGVNDYFRIPRMEGKPIGREVTIEVTLRARTAATSSAEHIIALSTPTGGPALGLRMSNDTTFQANTCGPFISTIPAFVPQERNFAVLSFNSAGYYFAVNGDILAEASHTQTLAHYTDNVQLATVGAYTNGAAQMRRPADEIRMYKRYLPKEEMKMQYNNGAGENPQNTEHLWGWWQFEAFETLDFSGLQDGSDMRLGIRDMSGNFNHLQPINQDTNPASGGFVLKPF
jgi:hypothetical protein